MYIDWHSQAEFQDHLKGFSDFESPLFWDLLLYLVTEWRIIRLSCQIQAVFPLDNLTKVVNHIQSSGVILPGSSQSKWCSSWARVSSILVSPNVTPRHILLPAPKGINSKWVPSNSIELQAKLSKIELIASCQHAGSLHQFCIYRDFGFEVYLVSINFAWLSAFYWRENY